MSQIHECDECGLTVAVDGCYAPSRPGERPAPLPCRAEGCGGVMGYACEGFIDEAGRVVEDGR